LIKTFFANNENLFFTNDFNCPAEQLSSHLIVCDFVIILSYKLFYVTSNQIKKNRTIHLPITNI